MSWSSFLIFIIKKTIPERPLELSFSPIFESQQEENSITSSDIEAHYSHISTSNA